MLTACSWAEERWARFHLFILGSEAENTMRERREEEGRRCQRWMESENMVL